MKASRGRCCGGGKLCASAPAARLHISQLPKSAQHDAARMQTAPHRSERRGKMREEATSRGRRWISPSIHNVVVAHHADMLYVRSSTTPSSLLRSDERMDWRCSAEPFYTTGLGLVVLSTLCKAQYAFSAPSPGRKTNFHHDSCNLRGIFLANPVCCHGDVGCNDSHQIQVQVKRSNSLLLVRCSR